MNISKHIDYTLLKPKASKEEIYKFYTTAIKNKYRGICTFDEYLLEIYGFMALDPEFKWESGFKISVVRGFPFGISDYQSKLILPHACCNEIDIVPNLNSLFTSKIHKELKAIRCFYKDRDIKVIIETEILNEEEIKHICELCNVHEIDFIKTCTGKNGNLSDEKLDMVLKYRGNCKVKASGGIKTVDKAIEIINKGVDVIGTSAII